MRDRFQDSSFLQGQHVGSVIADSFLRPYYEAQQNQRQNQAMQMRLQEHQDQLKQQGIENTLRQKDFEARMTQNKIANAQAGVFPLNQFQQSVTVGGQPRPFLNPGTVELPGGMGINPNQEFQRKMQQQVELAKATGQIQNQFQAEDESRKLLNENIGYTRPLSEVGTQGPTPLGPPTTELQPGFSRIPGTDQALDVVGRDKRALELQEGKRQRFQRVGTAEDTGEPINLNTSTGEYSRPDGSVYTGKIVPTPGRITSTSPENLREKMNDNPVIKDFQIVDQQYRRMSQVFEDAKESPENSIARDQAIITILNKMLDPASVVRESEYARTAQDIPFLNSIKGRIEKLGTGGAGITKDERLAIKSLVDRFYEAAKKKVSEEARPYKETIDRLGYSETEVMPTAVREALKVGGGKTTSGVTSSGIKFQLAK